MPFPPLNISHKIIQLGQGAGPVEERGGTSTRRRTRDIPLMREEVEESVSQEEEEEVVGVATTEQVGVVTPEEVTFVDLLTDNQTTPTSWPDPAHPAADEEFVNGVLPDYEDSNEPGSAVGGAEAMAVGVAPAAVLPTTLPPLLLELRWLPPRPPTSYDAFNVYIYRDGEGRDMREGARVKQEEEV